MFLIVTSKRDLTSDFVVLELKRRHLPYFRLNTEDFPLATFTCVPDAEVKWQLSHQGTTLSLASVKAAYFRRPGTPDVAPLQIETDRSYASTEWNALLQSLYWSLGERWLNSPFAIATAEDKLRQLVVAKGVGLCVPETLVGNDPVAAIAFASSTTGIVGKPLRNSLVKSPDGDHVVFTTRITPPDLAKPERLACCPLIFQREIVKKYDVRVTVVGEQVFAATIDSQVTPDTQVDWRSTETPLGHAVYELPSDVAAKCVALTQAMGLRFGALDFVLDRKDKLWFLEINPNGQWAWIETRTGLPISSAIVDVLEQIAHGTHT